MTIEVALSTTAELAGKRPGHLREEDGCALRKEEEMGQDGVCCLKMVARDHGLQGILHPLQHLNPKIVHVLAVRLKTQYEFIPLLAKCPIHSTTSHFILPEELLGER